MKNFFKKVAFVLALAMVLTNIGPAVKASAAEAPGLKYTSKVIYVGGSHFNDYEESCWTPSKNVTGYKVAYEVTTGKDLITVAANGKITATGNGIGKAVVAVTYSKAGVADIKKNFTVKVRRNATDVRLVNAVIAQIEQPLSAGTEIELSAAKSITKPASYAKGNYGLNNYMSVCSDQIDYKVSNNQVIKVENGKLIAVGTGEATLTVYTYENSDTTKNSTCEKSYTITVIGGIIDVKQTTITTLDVSFGKELESVKTDDFTISQADSSIVYDIKSVSLSSDKKTVKIETFIDMTDSIKFILKHEDKEYPFTATSGEVKDIINNRAQIPYAVGTVISVNLVDKDGVILDTVTNTTNRTDIAFIVDTADGYLNDDRLYLYEVGNKAKLTVTYTGSELDSNGNPVVEITREFTIIAANVDADAIVKATVTGNENCINWDTVSETRELYAEDEGKYIHVLVTDDYGSDMAQEYGYYLESSNENVLIVSNTQPHNHDEDRDFSGDKAVYSQIYGVKAGTANVIVRNAEGKALKTILVTVKAARKYNSFEVSTSTVTVSNSDLVGEWDSGATLTVRFKDQYGNDYRVDDVPNFGLVSSSNDIGSEVTGQGWWWDANQGYLFSASGTPAGTYRYSITYGGVTRYVNVIVKTPSGNDSYKLVLDKTNVDLRANHDTNGESINIRIAQYRGGIIYRFLDDSEVNEISITKGNNLANGNSTTTGSSLVYAVRSVSGNVITKIPTTGSYKVSADIAGRNTPLTTNFTITDSQPLLTATVDKSSITAGSKTIEAVMKEALTFRYDGKTLNANAEDSRLEIVNLELLNVGEQYKYPAGSIGANTLKGTNFNEGKIYIKSVTIRYFVRNDNAHNTSAGRWITFTVPVNRTFTIN